MPKLLLALTLPILLHSTAAVATFCRTWSEPRTEGILDRKLIPEASGLAASLRYPDRYYWVNDSGNKDMLFQTSLGGKNLKSIKVTEAKFRDTEAMAVANCGEDSCVIVGDVGNNNGRERNSMLYLFKEQDLNGTSAKPFRKVEFKYPDGNHDVEAMAALPDGRLLFITKELTLMNMVDPGLYVLEKAEWLEGSGVLQAKRIGTLPVKQWLPDKGFLGSAVTDAAYNAARNVLGVLTYGALIETPLEKLKDFNETRVWESGRDFTVLPIKALKQQETMTYDLKGSRVIWSSEFFPPETPVYSMTCERAEI